MFSWATAGSSDEWRDGSRRLTETPEHLPEYTRERQAYNAANTIRDGQAYNAANTIDGFKRAVICPMYRCDRLVAWPP
jgi:hypothetical protein